MSYLEPNLCVLPWLSLEVRPSGEAAPCCLFRDVLRAPNGGALNLSHVHPEDIWQCEDLRNLRQRFLRGERPDQCSDCWFEETNGRRSRRLRFRQEYSNVDFDEKNPSSPLFLDLKLGRECNLKCRICSAKSSTLWAREDQALGLESKAAADFTWPEISSWISNVSRLEFYGGEPLLSKKHIEFLKDCIRLDRAREIEIHYTSNATLFSQELACEIWPHFKNVYLSLSIDDLRERFEYQRFPAKWSDVAGNIDRFRSVRCLNLSICCTVNVLNVFDLVDLLQFFSQLELPVYLNLLHQPEYLNIHFLSDTAKLAIARQWKTYIEAEKGYYNELKQLLEAMKRSAFSSELQRQRHRTLVRHDRFRRQDYKEVFAAWGKYL